MTKKYEVVMSYEDWLKTDRGLMNENGEIIDLGHTSYTAYGRHIRFYCSRCRSYNATPWGFYQHLIGHNEVKRCITPSTRGGLMSGSSSKSHMVSFRLSNEAYAKIEKALECPANCNTSVGDYCKRAIERYAFRHSTRKFRDPILTMGRKGEVEDNG